MTTYILKTIICSALLILIYHLFLEREKMHRFNRFFLLFSIAFSFLIPLITIKISPFGFPILDSANMPFNSFQTIVSQQPLLSLNDNNSLSDIILIVYVAITTFLLCRFIINIFVIFFKIKNNNSVPYFDARIVLTKDIRIPYSFMKYVFIHLKDFENGTIEKEILGHELTHVKQKHSLDILFIELLMIFAWINPLLFLYRKAIQLNHEFLADESVVNTFSDTQNYQLLLLNKARQTNKIILSSPFNYLLTKKRIIMMSKKASLKAVILKQIALIPVLAATGFLFTTKIIAQDTGRALPQQQIETTQNGVSQELLKEYQDAINKCKKTLKDGSQSYSFNLIQSDKERLEKIFLQMSKEQQSTQMVVFVPVSSMVLKKVVPTKEQLEAFKDPKMYGVWVNGVRVSNGSLNNYKNTDFAYVSASKLEKNATNYGKHVFQVDLMTNDNFQSYNDQTIASNKNMMMLKSFGKKVNPN